MHCYSPFGKVHAWMSALLLTALFGVSSGQTLDDPGQFVQAVLSRHPSVLKQEKLIRAAEFGVKGSRLQPNPTITLAATAGDAGESSNALTQNFEISGQPRLRWQKAGAELESARQDLSSARREIAAVAYRSWLAYWRADRLANLAQLRSDLTNDVSKAARRRYEVGEISQNESLRVELAAAQAEVSRVKAQAQTEGAARELLILLGEPLDQALPHPRDPEALLATLSLEEALEAAAIHPDFVGMQEQLAALNYDVELNKKERAPTLGLSLYRSHLFRTSGIEQGAQVSLSWPIFDWGRIDNQVKQKREEIGAFAAGVDEALLQRRQLISNTWAKLSAARENQRVLEGQSARYEELARESRVAYDLGMVSLTDVLQTETSFREARVNQLEAQSEVYELELLLLENTGLPWPENFGPIDLDRTETEITP